jgi:hypothetical protein
MRTITLLFLMLLIAGSCAEKTAKSSEKEDDSELTENVNAEDNNNTIVSKKEIIKELRPNIWYIGTIGDLPIWFYIDDLDGSYGTAFYGYNSSKGAAIALNSKDAKANKMTLNFEDYASKYSETIYLTFNPTDGSFSGEWVNSKNKKLPVNLVSNSFIPQNFQEFLGMLPDIKNNLSMGYHKGRIGIKEPFKDYFNSNFNQYIPNLSDFVSTYRSYEDNSGQKIKAVSKDGIAIAKKQLAGAKYLVLIAADFSQEHTKTYEGTYELINERMLCAAIFDKNGNCLDAIRLGSDPQGEMVYYLNFSFEISKDAKINLIWDEFARFRGRHHVGRKTEIISPGSGKFKLENSFREDIEVAE